MYDIKKIRRKEYRDLDRTCYLDYGGATPYAKSLVNQSAKLWKSGLYGNPHSNSSSSLRATEYVDLARRRVLDFFRADPEHFDVVFVANATAAIKLVAYCFQEKGFWYGYHADAHTSLVGVRELAEEGYHCFASDKELDDWIKHSQLQENEKDFLAVDLKSSDCRQTAEDETTKLIGYPAQSNMNGHRTPKIWARSVREKSRSESASGRIYTLLDAAAYCSSAQLDLSIPDAAPDFISVSFYKIFGMPDLGALIVRKQSGHILTSRRYFGGGTVDMVVGLDSFHAKKHNTIHEVLEDGTVPFHNLVMLNTGIVLHKRLFHSMDKISEHSSQLALALYTSLLQLRHANGVSVCSIYKDDSSIYGDSATQGPTAAFNIRKSNGAWVHHEHVETLASACNIHIRTGGLCNPGGIAKYLELANWEFRRNYCEGFRCGEPFKVRGGKPSGVIRASLGGMSSKRDVETFVAFIQYFFVDNHCHKDDSTTMVGIPSSDSQHIWSIKHMQIFPIRHCQPWILPDSLAWEVNDARLAMDGEWCLIDLETNKILEDHDLTDQLAVRIDVELGRLYLEASNDTKSSHFEVDLWELPTGSWVKDSFEQIHDGTKRLARKYLPRDLEEFLTRALGQPTTLARFYEFRVGEAPDNCSTFCSGKISANSVLVQFSGDVPQRGAHVMVKPIKPSPAASVEFPAMLKLGNQTLFRSPREHMTSPSVAEYCRVPDTDEDLVSQNTAVRSTDLVVELIPSSTRAWNTAARDHHFCPVVGCRYSSVDYSTILQHLRSHARSFARRLCWFG